MKTETILQATELSKYFGEGDAMVRAVENVSLEIKRGEMTLALHKI